MVSASMLSVACKQARMIEQIMRNSSSNRTAFLLPDTSDHCSPPVIASKRKFVICDRCGGQFVSCSMIFSFQEDSWLLLLSLVSTTNFFLLVLPHGSNESFVMYFCFQKHDSPPPFNISSWDHMTITSVGLVNTKSSHFSCSSDLFVPLYASKGTSHFFKRERRQAQAEEDREGKVC